MPQRTCLVCGAEWLATDRSKTCSPECRRARWAEAKRIRNEHQRRPPKQRIGTCVECGSAFAAAARGKIPAKCLGCRSRRSSVGPRSGICEICGQPFQWNHPGRLPKACPMHQVERVRRWNNEYNKRTYSWQPVVNLRHCEYDDCHNFIVTTKSNRSQKFCEQCGVLRTRDIQRNHNAKRVASARLRNYGLTPETYQSMLDAQSGRCAACGTSEPGGMYKNWHIDHDHACCPGRGSCGKCVRGLLCNNCNLAAGYLADDPARATALAEYLTKTRQLRLVV